MARAPIPLTVLKPIGFGRLAAAAGASVQVNLRSGGAASVYNAETAGSVLANPLTSDAQGRVTGWVERGAYNLVASHPDLPGGGYTEFFDAAPGGNSTVDALWLPDGVVSAAKVASSIKDAAATTAALRTLGAGATQAAAGDHSHSGGIGAGGGGIVNVLDPGYGAKGDGVAKRAAGSITSGSATLTVAGAAFTSADVGKRVAVYGAGTSNPANAAIHAASISSVISATVVTLSSAATATVTGADVVYGTDDTTALTNAFAKAGGIYLPEKRIYFIRKAPRIYSDSHISGAEGTIFCDRSEGQTGFQAGFWLGNGHPHMYDTRNTAGTFMPSWGINNVTAGATSVTATTAADAANLAIGDFVFVRSVAEADDTPSGQAGTGPWYVTPHFAQRTKVVSANPTTGVIVLADAMAMPITGALISRVQGTDPANTGMPWHVVENVTVEDLAVEALDILALRPNMYNCRLRNLRGVRTRSGVSCQGAHVEYDNVGGDWSYGACEVKMASYDIRIRHPYGKFIGGTSPLGPISLGEQSWDIRIEQPDFILPPSLADSVAALTFGRCWDCTVEDPSLEHYGTTTSGPIIRVNGNGYTSYPPVRNRVRGGTLRNASNIPHHVRVGLVAGTQLPKDFELDGVHFPDAPSTGVSVKSYNAISGVIRRGSANATTRLEVDAAGGTWDIDSFPLPESARPAAALAEAFTREEVNVSTQALLVSGRLSFTAIPLKAGTLVSAITFISGTTALATGSNQWFALYSPALAKLGVTSDDGATAWAASALKTLSLASAYRIPTDGIYYLGVCVVATTLPTFTGKGSVVGASGLSPNLAFAAQSGLSTPATAPATATVVASAGNRPYAYVT